MIACKECRFYTGGGGFCCHANVVTPDPVNGWKNGDCTDARSEGGKCGPAARFYVTRKGSVAAALGSALGLDLRVEKPIEASEAEFYRQWFAEYVDVLDWGEWASDDEAKASTLSSREAK